MPKPAKATEQTPPAPAALPTAVVICGAGAAALARQLAVGGDLALALGVLVLGLWLLLRVLRRRAATRAYAQATLECQPDPVVVGRDFRIRLLLPRSGALAQPLTLRVVQRRLDTSNSSHESSLEWEQAHVVSPLPLPDGQQRIEAGFHLPADAPASGFYRDQCVVQWRVQLLDAPGLARLSFELPVRADPAAPAASALGEPLFADRPLSELPAGRVQVAPTWQEREDAGGFSWHFRRPVLRMLGSVGAVASGLIAVLLVQGRPPGDWRLQGDDLGLAAGLALLLPLALHALTARWWLRVDDDGLSVDRSSWLRPRRHALGAVPLEQVSRMTVATAGSSGAERAWYRLIATDGRGMRHWLSPRLRGPGLAQALSRRLQVAYRQRGARFAPGGTRRRPSPGPWLMAGALWGTWATLLAVAWTRLG